MSKTSVLISQPGAPGHPYLPYVWAIMKTHWERNAADPGAVSWLEPIYRRETVDRLDEHLETAPNVVGLSCYSWNFDLNNQVAKWAKKRNPQCVVVAGGPEPDYKDPRFFEDHPYIDVIVVQDGEIPFTRILEVVARGERDFRQIPGLYLPKPSELLPIVNGSAEPHLFTGKAVVPASFDYSPYAEQAPYFERLMNSRKGDSLFATLETTRGCPYACVYCDWGSATMSKVRRFDMARIEKEIDFLAQIRVTKFLIADANFGILPRDLQIADYLVQVRQNRGYPQLLYYSPAKNNPERTVEITKRLYDAKVVREHWLAVQHTDNDVLKAADRSNIPAEKYREVAAQLTKLSIPCYVQLIAGIPGDTLEKWKSCLCELMEWGVHDHYLVAPYCLLPNAPASDPAYLKEWEVKTIERELIYAYGLRSRGVDELSRNKIVVSFRGFTPEDWVSTMTFSACVRALHNLALTRLPSVYMRFSANVTYREFYGAVIDEFIAKSGPWAAMHQRIRELYEKLLQDESAIDDMPLEEFPNLAYFMSTNNWLFVQLVLKLDQFYADLTKFLNKRFPKVKHTASVLNYQKRLVVLPQLPEKSRVYSIDRDWPSYFKSLVGKTETVPVPPPHAFRIPQRAIITSDSTFQAAANVNDGSYSAIWEAWIRYIIQDAGRAEISNFPHPRVEPLVKLPRLLMTALRS